MLWFQVKFLKKTLGWHYLERKSTE